MRVLRGGRAMRGTRGGQALIYTGTHARGPCVVKIHTAEAAASEHDLVEAGRWIIRVRMSVRGKLLACPPA